MRSNTQPVPEGGSGVKIIAIMLHLNVEIKARCHRHQEARAFLQGRGAQFAGTDFQTDTYFHVPQGRLKLREGNVENALIYYQRPNEAGPGKSDVWLYDTGSSGALLRPLLEAALGVLAQVKKQREIYFLHNVKFHLDTVENLGTFIEIEAQDQQGLLGEQELYEQCRLYMELLGIEAQDLVEVSYSDMALQINPQPTT